MELNVLKWNFMVMSSVEWMVWQNIFCSVSIGIGCFDVWLSLFIRGSPLSMWWIFDEIVTHTCKNGLLEECNGISNGSRFWWWWLWWYNQQHSLMVCVCIIQTTEGLRVQVLALVWLIAYYHSFQFHLNSLVKWSPEFGRH